MTAFTRAAGGGTEMRAHGAETICLPDGSGFALAIWEDDGGVIYARLVRVDADDREVVLHEHHEEPTTIAQFLQRRQEEGTR